MTPLYREVREFQQADEIVQGWTVQGGGPVAGKLTLNQYLLNNGDRYYFIRYIPGATVQEPLNLSMPDTAAKTINQKGYWISTPRSEWLYRSYKIDSTFYDTRFNTDTALFLLKGYTEYHDPVFLNTAGKYADFLLDYAFTHRFTTKSGGWLVWDYGNENNPYSPTHVSLNHLLTEMNFLYEMYIVTQDIRYYDTAHKLKTAVKDTCKRWKNQSTGDLWYAYLKDGSFGLTDYPLVTLRDLKYSQKLFLEVDGAEDSDFGYMISLKEGYLKKNNLPLDLTAYRNGVLEIRMPKLTTELSGFIEPAGIESACYY